MFFFLFVLPHIDNVSKAPFDRSQNARPAGDREQRFNRRTREETQAERRPYSGSNGAAGGDVGGPLVDRPPRRANNGFPIGNLPGVASRRVFDRKSGSDKTGVKAVDKREGGGAHNWGTHKQDIEDLNKSNSDWETDKEAAASPASSANSSTEAAGANNVAEPQSSPAVPKEESAEQIAAAAAAAEAARIAEEEARELTLDEWKAQRGQRAKPQFNIRKAGEGEDTSQWKQMIALQSRKKNETDSDEDLEYDPSMYPQRVGRQKHLLNIEFNFNDGRRSGGNGPPRDARRGPGGAGGGPRGNGGADGGRRPLGGGGVRPPRRDQAQRNGGDAVVSAAPVAPFEAAPFAEAAAGAEEQLPRLGAEPSRKPRAPRADDRRRPYVSILILSWSFYIFL